MKSSNKNATKRNFMPQLSIILVVVVCLILIVKIIPAASADSGNNAECLTTIVVKEGDTLWSIAEQYMTDDYDDIRDYIKEVCRINNIKRPGLIMEGTLIAIPYDGETETQK